ncbi:hypothetical protein BDA99DRAFT_166823 [Phascolomyces articulosus]|uniref:FCH domain-containing protein n=1 Tax=Phascolomyces articulosus TaxID=60185 RepID=A0AAD5PAU9_9FUNG|nr:hypothetical protein BDA99DRAFT_166823 [Phascolomyces articulosus]
MPPNSATVDSFPSVMPLKDHFWSCDKQGMNKLISAIKHSYESLDAILEAYVQRALLEREYGQQLMELNKSEKNDENDEKTESSSNQAVKIIYQEINKTAQSHIDMANRIEEEVAPPLKDWISTHRDGLNTIIDTLDALYDDRQEKVKQLLLVRGQYQQQDQQRPSSVSSEYQSVVDAADKAVREWNRAWKNACQQIEIFEHERMDLLTTNVWDYANFCSARLLVQDEWSEKIRVHLESCTIEEELTHCIKHYGTGSSTAPTTMDYVEFYSKKYKRESVINKRLPPQPGTMSNTETTMNKPNEIPTSSMNNNSRFSSINVSRKPVATDPGLEALLKRFEATPLTTTTTTTSMNNSNKSNGTSNRPINNNGFQQKKQEPSTDGPPVEIQTNHHRPPVQKNRSSTLPQPITSSTADLPTTTTTPAPVRSAIPKPQQQQKKRDNRPALEPIQTQQPVLGDQQPSACTPILSSAHHQQQQQQPPKSPRPQARPAPQMNHSLSTTTDNVMRQPPKSPILSSAALAQPQQQSTSIHSPVTGPATTSATISHSPVPPMSSSPCQPLPSPSLPAQQTLSTQPQHYQPQQQQQQQQHHHHHHHPHHPPSNNMMPLQPPSSPMMMGSSTPHSPIMTPLQHSPALQPMSSPMMAPTSPGMGRMHSPIGAPQQQHYSYQAPLSPMMSHTPIIPPPTTTTTATSNNTSWSAAPPPSPNNPYYYNKSPLMMNATPQSTTPYTDDQRQAVLPDGRPIMHWGKYFIFYK